MDHRPAPRRPSPRLPQCTRSQTQTARDQTTTAAPGTGIVANPAAALDSSSGRGGTQLEPPALCRDHGASAGANSPAISDTGSMYIDSDGAHWTSILDGIAGLRSHLDQQGQSAPSSFSSSSYQDRLGGDVGSEGCVTPRRDAPSRAPDAPLLLVGSHAVESAEEILAAIPERFEANRLVSQYFSRSDLGSSEFLTALDFPKLIC